MAPPSPDMPAPTSLLSQIFFSGATGSAEEIFRPVYEAAKTISVPVMIVSDSKDSMAPPQYNEEYYPILKGAKQFVEVYSATGGLFGEGHLDYLDILADANARSTIQKYTRNWFDYYLKGDTSKYTYIFGTGAQNDLASGALSALHFEIH